MQRYQQHRLRVHQAGADALVSGHAPANRGEEQRRRAPARVKEPELALTAAEQARDFIHMDDVMSARASVLMHADRPAAHKDIEVGSGKALTIRHFVETTHRVTRSTTRLKFRALPYRPNEAMPCRADTCRMNELRAREHIPNAIDSDFSTHALCNDLLPFPRTAARCPLFASTTRPRAFFRDHEGSTTSSSSAAQFVLRCDLARSHLVEVCGVPAALRRRFHAQLVVGRLFHRRSRIGLISLRHFYFRGYGDPVSPGHLACLIYTNGVRKARRALKRHG